jgi:calcineurin-like phosphoesterase family protein
LTNDTDRAFIFRRFSNYQNFINGYFDKETLSFDHINYYFAKHISVANLNISILGLNSAWLSESDEDKEKLVLGDMQVRNALAEAKNPDICLAVMHHPFDWLQKFDIEDVKPSLSKECQFILHGHLHEQSISQIISPGIFSTVVGAGACFDKRTSFNSYNFVQLDLDSNKGKIHLRMYSDRDSGFWTNDTITYSDAPNGVYEFLLPNDICKPSAEESAIESQESKVESTPKVAQLR